MKNKSIKYKCPCCNGNNIIDYGETFECVNCQLDFFKESLESYEKINILAISELNAIAKIFEKN